MRKPPQLADLINVYLWIGIPYCGIAQQRGEAGTGTLKGGGYRGLHADTITLETQDKLNVETIDLDATAETFTTVGFNNVRTGLQLEAISPSIVTGCSRS